MVITKIIVSKIGTNSDVSVYFYIYYSDNLHKDKSIKLNRD